MARLARVIAVDTPHHITQRGNARRFILESGADRNVYLQLLRHYSQLHRLALLGYCLMSNHVHLIAIPERADSLALTLKGTHGRYAAYFNARHASSGHVWQGRFYSCPLDAAHVWEALRYAERNPVRAGLATTPQDYEWSSAPVHCGAGSDDALLDLAVWRQSWTPDAWKRHLRIPAEEQEDAIRRNTHTGRPLGTQDFVQEMERQLNRILVPQAGGRPPGQQALAPQKMSAFEL